MFCTTRFNVVHKLSHATLFCAALLLANITHAVVHINSIQLQESTFCEDLNVGRDITDLSADTSTNGVPGIRVTGESASVLIDREGKIIERTTFSSKGTHVVHFPSAIGAIKYADLGGRWQPIGIYNAEGVYVWKYWNGYKGDFKGRFIESSKAPQTLVPYITKDGSIRFIISHNGRGIAVLDEEGNIVYEDKNTFAESFQTYDTDHDGISEIIYSSRTSLVIRDIDLHLVREVKYPEYIKSFSINTWPANDNNPTLFFRRRGEILIADLDGNIINRIPSEIQYAESQPQRTEWIQLDGQSEPCLVFIEAINPASKTAGISILSAEGKLLFQETINDIIPSYFATAQTNGLPRAFLIGKRNSISKYESINTAE